MLADCSSPTETRKTMFEFFTRRAAQLQHKKHKLLKRWATVFQDSEGVDYVSHSLDQELKFLQVEQDAIATRLMRLQTDDLYSHTNENERFNLDSGAESRGGKSTKLYKESDM